MIRWICGVKLQDEVSSESLLVKLEIADITSVLRSRRLRWYGHVKRSPDCIHHVTEFVVPGSSGRGRGRPRKNWSECVNNDITFCNLGNVDPLDRLSWRRAVRAS